MKDKKANFIKELNKLVYEINKQNYLLLAKRGNTKENFYDEIIKRQIELDCFEAGEYNLQKLLDSKKEVQKGIIETNDLEFQSILERFLYWLNKHIELKNENKANKLKPKKWHNLIPHLVNGSFNKYSNIESSTEFSKKIIDDLGVELEVKGIKPYIQESYITKNSKNSKNLFSEKKVIEIRTYCIENEIEITDEHFIKKMKEFKLN